MAASTEPLVEHKTNYLNAEHSVKSWLLTTDHKRIASAVPGEHHADVLRRAAMFARLIRLELITPQGDLLSSDTYNSCSRMHGIIMIFFFLIPSIPATLGNFLVPMMIGARDLAFPRLNLLSWYLYITGAARHAVRAGHAAAWTPAGRSTRRSAPLFSNSTWSR